MSETNNTKGTATSKIIEKVRALLNMADPLRGASQQECETAMRKAQELMTEHGIQQMDVGQSDGEVSVVDQSTFSTGRKKRDEDRWIPVVLNSVFEVKTIYTETYDEVQHKYRFAYILVGEPIDIEMAKIGYKIIYDAMRLGLNAHLRDTGKKWNTHTANSFFRGVADGFMKESTHGRQAAMRRFKKEEQDRFAIVLVEKGKRIAKYVDDTIKTRSTKSRSRAGLDSSAFNHGKQVGGAIDFTSKLA